MKAEEVGALSGKLSRFIGQFGRFFATWKGREHFRVYIEGQLGPLERKSIEPIADAAGVPSRLLQGFLSVLTWDEGAIRDKVQEIVKRRYAGKEGVLIIDETSVAKKGTETACVQRQYCGATGKVDNCVVMVDTAFASGGFHTLIDADLYLPKSWDEDVQKRKKAGIPRGVVYRPMHAIALEQVERALANGVPAQWVTADERYAEVPAFIAALEERGLGYVVEVPTKMTGWTKAPDVWDSKESAGDEGKGLHSGAFPRIPPSAPPAQSVADIAKTSAFTKQTWTPYQVKETLKGPEVWEVRTHPFFHHRDGLPSRELTLIVARHVLEGTTKYFLAYGPAGTPIETFLRIAFTRRRVERCFEDSKGEIGMDHFEVRGWRSIHRHLILSMVSHLFLAEQKERLRGGKSESDGLPAPDGHAMRA